MKVFALFLVIFALLSSVAALKDAICGKPAFEIGRCQANKPRYSYVASENQCMKFGYGGCDGNENNFYTQTECEDMCKE